MLLVFLFDRERRGRTRPCAQTKHEEGFRKPKLFFVFPRTTRERHRELDFGLLHAFRVLWAAVIVVVLVIRQGVLPFGSRS